MSCSGLVNAGVGRYLLSVLVGLVLLTPSLAAGENESIEKRMYDSLRYLASDEMKGRAVGTPELDEAAEFIHREFKAIGLQTQVYDDGPFQTVKLAGRVRIGSPDQNKLVFSSPTGAELKCALDDEFRPLAIGGSHQVNVPLVFAGYGITAPEYEYNDYEGLDVKGKAVIVLRKEPQQSDRESIFRGRANTRHAYFRAKIENAVKHGAAAVILINDRQEVSKRARTLRNRWNRKLRQVAAEQKRFSESETSDPEAFEKHRQLIARMIQDLTNLNEQLARTDPLLAVDGAGGVAVDGSVPVFFCRRDKIDHVLRQAEQPSLVEIEEQLDELKPIQVSLADWSVTAKSRLELISGRNVIGILEGHGDLAEQTVIVGAHYDHVGMGGMGSLAPWTRAVHNGADDNASGVVALLEVARRLAARPEPMRRRVVFIAFTAEEMGLLGSAHYIREPRFPLSSTVAMLNLDMVGRLGNSPLTIQGQDTAEEFKALLEDVTTRHELRFQHKRGGNGPSDHAVFFRKKIPVMHFFTGIHRDYHRPSDDVEKVDIVGVRRISGMVADIVEQIADAEAAPTFRGKTKRRDEKKPEAEPNEASDDNVKQDEQPDEQPDGQPDGQPDEPKPAESENESAPTDEGQGEGDKDSTDPDGTEKNRTDKDSTEPEEVETGSV